MQENKKTKTGGRRVFLLGEEPNGEQFVITDAVDSPAGVEIIQRPLSRDNTADTVGRNAALWSPGPGSAVSKDLAI